MLATVIVHVTGTRAGDGTVCDQLEQRCSSFSDNEPQQIRHARAQSCSARSFPRFASCFGGSLGRPLAVVSRQILVSCGHNTKCYRPWYMFLVAGSCVIYLVLWPLGVFCFSLTSISLVSAVHKNVVRGPIPAAHGEVAVSVSFPR